MRIYWINELNNFNVGMMSRPRGNDWLEDEIAELTRYNVTTIVSLLEYEEIYDLELEKEAFYCKINNIEYINFPIKDRGLPDKISFLELVHNLDKKLKNKEKIVIHCRMGIGRTSMLVAALLLKRCFEKDTIFDFLSEKRTLRVPDTQEQIDWIYNL